MMPPRVVPWPPMNLVAECTTMSAPCSMGRIRYGVPKVLSMTSGRPCLCAMAAMASMSGDIAVGVAQGLQIDSLGVGLDGILHLGQVMGVDEGGGNAELGQGVLQQVVAAAVDGLLCHDVVTGLCQCLNGVGDGSSAGSGSQSSHAAFQSGNALLEHILSGVGQTAVDVAGVCQTEAVRSVLAVAEHIGSGLVNGHCAGIGRRIGLLLANVQLKGLKFIVRHCSIPLYLYLKYNSDA